MTENTTKQFVNIIDLSHIPQENYGIYSGGKLLEELVTKLGCEYDYYDNTFVLDISEPAFDELGHFLDNCNDTIFIISNLSYSFMNYDSLKQMIDLVVFYDYKTILILADYGKKDYPNNFSLEKEFNSFELQKTCKDFYAISDIWFRKYLKINETEPSNVKANRYSYSNKEIVDIASNIIRCYLTKSENKIPLMMQERVYN